MKKGNPGQPLRKDVGEGTVARLCPDGMVELNMEYESSWFLTFRPKLARAFKRAKRSAPALRSES